MTTTSGWQASIASIAARPSAAVATTVKPSMEPSSIASPSR